MDKMNISDMGEQDTDQLFNNSGSFDQDLQAQTSQLINQVFNSNYEPVYNPARTKAQQQMYKLQKQKENKKNKHKLAHHHKIYQNLQDQDLSLSFRQFLTRAQQKIDSHQSWVHKMQKSKLVQEKQTLKEMPDILRGSREKILPIYQRCVDLQKEKDKKLEQKRIQKHKTEAKMIKNMSFRPNIKNNNKASKRTFEQYFVEKQIWKKQKQEATQKKRVKQQVKKLKDCTFAPVLVSKYNKPNTKIIPGEKVQDRLLRSLQRSRQKQQNR